MYTVNLVVDEETANDFATRGHTIKQMDEGSAVVIKRKVNGPNGMVRTAPRLLDQNKQEVNLAVGNGSKVRVQCNEYDWEYAGKAGKVYDVTKIEDEQRKAGASVSISKIGTLNVLVEALNYASQGHQGNLEAVLKESPEAIVEQDEDEAEVSEESE